jgi:hypothetical protein
MLAAVVVAAEPVAIERRCAPLLLLPPKKKKQERRALSAVLPLLLRTGLQRAAQAVEEAGRAVSDLAGEALR